jgi:LPPG:FO 2-phospho-L-lactate transferase
VVALSGGVGGAKLAHGLDQVLGPGQLTVVANPGDDFEHLGLAICPDLDTLMYTLAGVANPRAGWGLAGETWSCMAALERLGGETWFRLGDADLATHLERTRRLRTGASLALVTAGLCARLGVQAEIIPATDAPVRTVVDTPHGALAFQHYFVRERCEPRVVRLRYEGADAARPTPRLLERLAEPGLEAIVICPSNPYLSIEPILAIPGVRDALRASAAPVVAVSPVIGGDSLKGPTAKIMRELGVPVSVTTIARHYGDLIDGLLIDEVDRAEASGLALRCAFDDVRMRNDAERARVASAVLELARSL